jgi:hypothetical protein
VRALLAMLRRRAQTTWIGYVLAVGFAAAIPVTNYFTLQAAMGRMRFVAMDSRDTFYLTSAGSFEEARHLRLETAKLATETIFLRGPEGLNDTERLERLFNPETTSRLKADVARDAEVFRAQQMHQSCEMGQIKELSVDDNTALVSVETQVLRTGVFNQRLINDTKRCTVFLRLTVNNAMSVNGRYPLVVTNYEERFE